MMNMTVFRLGRKPVMLLILALLLLVALPAAAQSVDTTDALITDDQVNEVAKDLYCPVCESTPLDVCPTEACADWREVIRGKLAEGQTRDEIFAYFARQYGDGVLARPPARGMSLLLWVFPVIAVIVGGVFFTRYMRNLRTGDDTAAPTLATPTASVPASQPAKDDYRSRIEEELRKQ